VGTTSVLAAGGGGFQPPGVQDFQFPAIVAGVTKPVVLIALSVIIVAVFFVMAANRAKLVPGKFQFAAEGIYDFVRNSIARDLIGSKEARPYLPLLLTLFCFILVNNLFGFFPFLQFPTMSHVGFPYALAGMVWVIYNFVGLRRHGFVGYLKLQTWPPGVPGWVRFILTPIEFISNILVRPVTLSLRLFANMFAGHLVLLVFILGGEYLLVHGSIGLKIASPFAFLLAIVLSFFELLVQFLQAYIFVALTASYIGGALTEEH
jgi:F-type H+-transporting ATPase subunit a